MKITLAQINTKLGDVQYNKQKIVDIIKQYAGQTQCIVFPEMSLPGYPLHDKIYDKNLLKKQQEALVQIQQELKSIKSPLTVVLGFVDFDKENLGPDGRWTKRNAAAVVTANDIQTYHKQLLPNYDVFYDKRYYKEGTEPLHFKIGNKTATLTVCEDMRDEGYSVKPIANAVKAQHTDLIINISSSPFATEKLTTRYNIIKKHAKTHGIPFVYVNQVGAQDGNINDGASMVAADDGRLIALLDSFKEEVRTIDLDEPHADLSKKLQERNDNKYGQILEAIKIGIEDYMKKTGIKDVVIGVSGGVDSALSLAILSMILPPERIHAFYLPSKHSQSLEYVNQLCKGLNIPFRSHDINAAVQRVIDEYDQVLGEKMGDITYQNIQARERGQVLTMYANHFNALIINNSNRTEIAQGYATLYGDTIGFLSPLGDLIKTEVYDLARYINATSKKPLIPESIITRKASAELTDNQVDPFDYENESVAIDMIFDGEDLDVVAQKTGVDRAILEKYHRRCDLNEFKRVQSPRVFKLKPQSAGMGRIYPLVFG